MANTKVVFSKAKELHYKMGGGNPQVLVGRIASELELTNEEVDRHLQSLKKLRLINYKDHAASLEITKVGLSTQVGA